MQLLAETLPPGILDLLKDGAFMDLWKLSGLMESTRWNFKTDIKFCRWEVRKMEEGDFAVEEEPEEPLDRLTSCLPFILQILISFLFDSHVLFCKRKTQNIQTRFASLQKGREETLQCIRAALCPAATSLPCCRTSRLPPRCPAPRGKGRPWREEQRERCGESGSLPTLHHLKG